MLLWLRIGFLHPVVPVVLLVALSDALGRGGQVNVDTVFLLGLVLLVTPLVSAVATGVTVRRVAVSGAAKAGMVSVTLVVGIVAAFVGSFAWADAMEMACEGRYECPM
jgi:hypothetical protein